MFDSGKLGLVFLKPHQGDNHLLQKASGTPRLVPISPSFLFAHSSHTQGAHCVHVLCHMFRDTAVNLTPTLGVNKGDKACATQVLGDSGVEESSQMKGSGSYWGSSKLIWEVVGT